MRRGTAESRFSLCSGRCSVSGRLYLLNTSSIGGILVISGSNAPAGSMTREAALLLFNLVHVTVSTIWRISFVCAQARIETEYRRARGAADLTGIAHIEVDVC